MNVNNIFSTAEIRKYLWIFSTIAILSFVLARPLSAQDEPQSGDAEEDRGLSAMGQSDFLTSGLYGGGLTFIDGDAYLQLQLQPDIPIGNVGIGLDLVVLYNPFGQDTEPRFLAEDGESWDNPSTWLRLIRYVRYGRPYDPFYFRFGELDYLTIGHGSIMSGYSNYDRRGLRLNLRNSENRYGVETMLNDVGNPTIFGGRGFWRPFLREENNNLFTRFELGATYLADINPNLQEEGEEPLEGIGVDVGFPIIERSSFRLDLYNDFTIINTLSEEPENMVEEPLEIESIEQESTRRLESAPVGENLDAIKQVWGNAVGVGFTFTKAIFKVEYRIIGDGYTPSIFDYTYESSKLLVPEPEMPQFLGLETDTELLSPEPDTVQFLGMDLSTQYTRGFFSQLILQPLPQIQLLGVLEDYENSAPKLYLGITESGLVPRLSLRMFYAKRDIGQGDETSFFSDLFDLDEKSAFSLELRYAVFPPVETIILREYTFRRTETAEGTSRFEPIHKTSFMVGVSTDF